MLARFTETDKGGVPLAELSCYSRARRRRDRPRPCASPGVIIVDASSPVIRLKYDRKVLDESGERPSHFRYAPAITAVTF